MHAWDIKMHALKFKSILKLAVNPVQNLACDPSSIPYSHRYFCSGNLSDFRLDACMNGFPYIVNNQDYF